MDKSELKPVIESLIFAAEGVITTANICNILEGEDRALIKAALTELVDDYRVRNGGVFIEEVASGFQFRTNPSCAPWIRRLFKTGGQKISRAAMESLAIIAYKQPLTRGELEAVRGVDSGGVLSTLMEKRLIKIIGKKEVPGRPAVYGTTREFLETFDLKDLSCLPSLKEIETPEEEDGTRLQNEEERAVEGLFGKRRPGAEKDEAAPGDTAGNGQSEASDDERDAGRHEASEGDSGRGHNLEEEGRGDDPRGQGEGQRKDGNGAGDKG